MVSPDVEGIWKVESHIVEHAVPIKGVAVRLVNPDCAPLMDIPEGRWHIREEVDPWCECLHYGFLRGVIAHKPTRDAYPLLPKLLRIRTDQNRRRTDRQDAGLRHVPLEARVASVIAGKGDDMVSGQLVPKSEDIVEGVTLHVLGREDWLESGGEGGHALWQFFLGRGDSHTWDFVSKADMHIWPDGSQKAWLAGQFSWHDSQLVVVIEKEPRRRNPGDPVVAHLGGLV